MTRWVVIFDDTPAMIPHRRANGAAHVAYCEANRDRLLVGGGLSDAPSSPFTGGLWIVEANTHDEVVELVMGDPYYNPAHRRFQIKCWGRVLDGPVTI
ncbi:MAG: YciI family protein [Pseudomonadota bacterium]